MVTDDERDLHVDRQHQGVTAWIRRKVRAHSRRRGLWQLHLLGRAADAVDQSLREVAHGDLLANLDREQVFRSLKRTGICFPG